MLRHRTPPFAGTLLVVAAAAFTACRSNHATAPDGGPGVDAGADAPAGSPDAAGDAGIDGPALDAERAPQPTLEPTLTGGTRLKPRVWLTSDGDTLPSVTARFDLGDAQGFIGQWFDSELGVDCMFDLAEDGVRRCLPVDRAPVEEGYIDDACTVVGYAYPLLPARYRTSMFTQAPCVDATYRVRRIVGPIPAPTTLYRKPSAGACTGLDNGVSDTHWFRAELAPPSTFVAATTSVVAGAGGLSIVTTVAADGAIERVSLLNAARNEACAPAYLGTASRCLPEVMQTYAQPAYFTDSACQTPSPAVYVCAARPYVWSSQPLPSVVESCGVAPVGLAFKTFAPVPGLFLSKAGTCTAVAPDPASIVAQSAADIPLADFPVVETVQRGRGRLKTPYLAPPGGPALVRSGALHFDSALNADCEMVVVDGRTLCRPAASVGVASYADPECKVPVYRPPTLVDCRKPPPGAVRIPATGAVYRVTDRPYVGGTYGINGTPAACHPTGVSSGLPVVELDAVPVEGLVGVRAGVE